MSAGLPRNDRGLVLSFYGDDFTGSTDVLEALTVNGVRSALFLAPPTAAQLETFPGLEACGVAGMARTLTPAQTEQQVRPVLEALAELQAPLFHYKICSTFDSSVRIGNIGHAIRLVADVFDSGTVPLVVGAPVLRRYCVFGNVFAAAGPTVYRLDRHPTMSRHPVTPMQESHLPTVLAAQGGLRTAPVDVTALRTAAACFQKSRTFCCSTRWTRTTSSKSDGCCCGSLPTRSP